MALKHGLWTKITGGQRVALFGANMWDLPLIFKEITSGVVVSRFIVSPRCVGASHYIFATSLTLDVVTGRRVAV